MDDEEDMTLSQLGTCRIGHSSDIATEDLSTNDCETKKSDESDGVNNNTNAEEHLSGVGSVSYSELIGNSSEKSRVHEKFAASDEGNIQDKGKDILTRTTKKNSV